MTSVNPSPAAGSRGCSGPPGWAIATRHVPRLPHAPNFGGRWVRAVRLMPSKAGTELGIWCVWGRIALLPRPSATETGMRRGRGGMVRWKILKHRHLPWWKGEAVKWPSPCLERREQVFPAPTPQIEWARPGRWKLRRDPVVNKSTGKLETRFSTLRRIAAKTGAIREPLAKSSTWGHEWFSIATYKMSTLRRRVFGFCYLGHSHVCTLQWYPDSKALTRNRKYRLSIIIFLRRFHQSYPPFFQCVYSLRLPPPSLPPTTEARIRLDYKQLIWLYFLKISEVTFIWLVSLLLPPPQPNTHIIHPALSSCRSSVTPNSAHHLP